MQRCVLHSLCYSQWCGSVLMPREVIVAPSSWSSGIAQLLGEEKCLACNSAVLGPHHKHAGSWTSLTAASPLSQQCPWVSWLQGRSSPLTPALAAFSCSASPTHQLLFLCKCLFSVSLMSALLLSFHWSSLLPVPPHCFTSFFSIHKIQSVLDAFHALSSTRPNL